MRQTTFSSILFLFALWVQGGNTKKYFYFPDDGPSNLEIAASEEANNKVEMAANEEANNKVEIASIEEAINKDPELNVDPPEETTDPEPNVVLPEETTDYSPDSGYVNVDPPLDTTDVPLLETTDALPIDVTVVPVKDATVIPIIETTVIPTLDIPDSAKPVENFDILSPDVNFSARLNEQVKFSATYSLTGANEVFLNMLRCLIMHNIPRYYPNNRRMNYFPWNSHNTVYYSQNGQRYDYSWNLQRNSRYSNGRKKCHRRNNKDYKFTRNRKGNSKDQNTQNKSNIKTVRNRKGNTNPQNSQNKSNTCPHSKKKSE